MNIAARHIHLPREERSAPAARNNIGFLRLVFASCVLVGHSVTALGARAPFGEPLRYIFPYAIDIAAVSVDAFFLISGWLITMSMDRAASVPDYLQRRVFRIVPAYLIAFALSALLIPWAFGIAPNSPLWLPLFLQPPAILTVNGDLVSPNGSLWTIAYEFRCYLLVALIAACGGFQYRRVQLAATLAVLLGFVLTIFPPTASLFDGDGRVDTLQFALFGHLETNFRLFTFFLIGMVAYQYRAVPDRIITGRVALLSTILMCATFCHYLTPEIGLAVFGSPALYWLCFKANLGRAQALNDRYDISYGTYLYGAPVLLLLTLVDWPSTWLYLPVALLCAWGIGTLSWLYIEKPFKRARIRWPSAPR